jgi:hypothetical protein
MTAPASVTFPPLTSATVDVEIAAKTAPLSSFQKHMIQDICNAEYFTFIGKVEKFLEEEKYEEIKKLFLHTSLDYQLAFNYRRDFDFLLEKVLNNSKDDKRFHKALGLIHILTKHQAATQFAQLCEIACLFKLGDKEKAEKHLKLLSHFAAVRSYSQVMTQHLDIYRIQRLDNLVALFSNLPAKLKKIPQQLLPPLKA